MLGITHIMEVGLEYLIPGAVVLWYIAYKLKKSYNETS